jgi:2-hydroxy fatty acid dioxygenase
MVAMLLTATSYAHREHGQQYALYVHVCSWIMQFIGHGVGEGRSPALLDNIVGGAFHRGRVLQYVLTFSSSGGPGSLLRSSRGVLKFLAGFKEF